jgi:hypothetical protein
MTQSGEKLYRTEDPTRPDVAELQEKLRAALDRITLDDDTDFYDKLYALEATQRGEFQEYRTNPVVEKLHQARRGLVMLTASRMLIVGHLVPESPWSFLYVSKDQEPKRIDLAVRFSQAYRVNDTRQWEHESYGTMRSEIGPSAERVPDEQLAVGLPIQPIGSEYLYTKVEAYSDEVFSGEYAIHQRVVAMQRGKGEREQAALHSAVSQVVSQMS